MTERMIKNRIGKLDVIAAQQKELEAQAGKIRNEIKADMEGIRLTGCFQFRPMIAWEKHGLPCIWLLEYPARPIPGRKERLKAP